MDEPEFVKIIEDQGGLVVYEDTCFGARYYEEPVSEEEDPLNSIANRYFYRIPCARMGNSFDRRYENLEKIYREFKAEGIISQILFIVFSIPVFLSNSNGKRKQAKSQRSFWIGMQDEGIWSDENQGTGFH